jgi:hypothetical protein
MHDSHMTAPRDETTRPHTPQEAPLACTLDATDRSARLTHARELGEQALVGLEVDERRALLRGLVGGIVAGWKGGLQ